MIYPCFRQAMASGEVVHGITTAAAIFAAAAIGATAGQGREILATFGALVSLSALEIRHIPGLRLLDGRRWSGRLPADEVAQTRSIDPEV
ncbi:hypothetical protein GCM10009753_70410 [Streptantibioticus ferralitis]